MKPYYQDDQVTLYHGDCLEITDWLTADVLVTDPPYGTELMSTANGNAGGYGRVSRADRAKGLGHIANDTTTETRDSALASWGDRPALVFGSPRLPDPPGRWVDRLVWDKKRPGMNGGPWRYRHESIYATAGFERRNNETTSILVAFPDQSLHIHAKPLGLMTSLVDCAPRGVIADPFAGSGTTLVAARNLGRRAIGVELEERYCELIATRLDQMCLDFGEGA
ncbi:DNA-methyltransferase [Mycolicibacterium peregrinum]